MNRRPARQIFMTFPGKAVEWNAGKKNFQRTKRQPYRWEYHNPILGRDYLVSDRIIRWPDGRDVRIELAIDITKRKRTEDKLKEYGEKLEEMVEEKTAMLRKMVDLMAGRLKPELILLDIQLPVMDGHEVARWLKDQPETRDIPIVAVTSYAMPADRERVLANGCIGYIEKPIDLDTFVSGIERYLLTQEPDIGGGS